MATLPTNGFRPAPGLTFLTSDQVKQIDAKAASISAFVRESGESTARLVLHFNQNGFIRRIEWQLTEKIEPVLNDD